MAAKRKPGRSPPAEANAKEDDAEGLFSSRSLADAGLHHPTLCTRLRGGSHLI